MTEKELRRLSRADLLEMLIDQSEQLQELKTKYEQAEQALQQRQLSIQNAGSIAEAALQLSGVFDAAQDAADQYLDNVRALAEHEERRTQAIMEQSGRMLLEAEKRCEKMESETKIACAEMVAKAKAESQAYWEEVQSKLEAFYQAHAGLRELLSILVPKTGGQ